MNAIRVINLHDTNYIVLWVHDSMVANWSELKPINTISLTKHKKTTPKQVKS